MMMKTLLTMLAWVALATAAVAQTNATITRQGTNVVTRTNGTLTWSNGFNFTGTAAAATISNLFASNSLPSGAAVAGTPPLADGAGGTAFSTPTQWTVSSGTVTSNAPALNVSQTWSNAAVAFTPVLVNVSNAASSNTSRLLSLRVGGSEVFGIDRAGNIEIPNGAINARAGSIGYWSASSFRLNPTSLLEFGGGTGDPIMTREAIGQLALRNGTNAQQLQIAGSYSNSTNYRRLAMGMSNNGIGFLRPEQAGPSTNANNFIYISGLPTTNTGLPSGVLWNSNGTVVVNP
jgi:hypothetical protein